jgi:hypothetical protein
VAKKKPAPPKPRDPAEALENLERPQVKWKIVAQVGVALVVLWGLAIGLVPWVSYWGVGVVGVLTAVVLGFAIYLWRLTRKSAAIVDILKGATDEAGRKAALEKLREGKGGDAMRALAEAQLVAREAPAEAMRILEGIDLKKAPAVVQDDVRANLGMLYLMNNRTKEARDLADEIRLDRQPQPKAKAMYAAVVAEAFARTGKTEEASKLLETYAASDPAYGEVGAMLYRAQVYTYLAAKKRGLAKKAMEKMATIDTNMVAAFVMKGTNPQLGKMAREILQASGAVPRPKMKMMRR